MTVFIKHVTHVASRLYGFAISEGLDVPPTGPWAVREWETTGPDAVI